MNKTKKEDNLKDIQKEIENLEKQEQEQENKPSCKEELDTLNDKYLRLVAEFENFRRRSEEEKNKSINYWWKKVLQVILPFLDNFKRAMDSCDKELKNNEWVKWIFAIEKNLISDLEKIWFKKIEAKWKGMDFNKHEALMQDPNVEKNIISQVLEDWYEYNWEIVRAAKVSVWSLEC